MLTLNATVFPKTTSRIRRDPLRRNGTHVGHILTNGKYPSLLISSDVVSYPQEFFYGYRDVLVSRNGHEVWEKIPLTQEDMLHPQLEDHEIKSDTHVKICIELCSILQSYLTQFPWMYFIHDVLVKWGILNLAHAPDIAIFSGITNHSIEIDEDVNVTELGWNPILAFEITSHATRRIDIRKNQFSKNKYLQYEYIGVPYYVVIDQVKRPANGAPPIMGYQLVRRRYRQLSPDRYGRVWIEPLGLSLGPYQDRVAWFDAYGNRLLTHTEEQQRANQEAEARKMAEEAQRAAEEELRQLKAKLGMLDD